MAVAGTHPEAGVRVAFDLRSVDDVAARYHGEAFTPGARYELSLSIELASGKAKLEVVSSAARDGSTAAELDAGDVQFVTGLGAQLWKLAVKTPAEQGGGQWSRRIQRWRGPK